MLVVYIGTAMLAGRDPAPVGGDARAVFEIRHALTHLVTFALEVWLLCRAVRLPSTSRITRDAAILIGLGVLIGVGQETLQALGRHYLSTLDSLWDLSVDIAGSTLGWWLYNLRTLRAERAGRIAG
jgi:hypothetical protein